MVPTSALPRSPGHPFYMALNKLLAEAKFDAYVEGLCEPLYRESGHPSIPPGVFFRMLFIGYFEGIDSQRGIAWRCSDSLSLRTFLGLKPTESSPEHSSLTVIRKRMPKDLIEQVFAFVLKVAFEKKLLKDKAIGVDATTLEANAAMTSIVRRDGGATWKQYLTKLAKEAGIEDPTDDELRQFDRTRKGKKTSNHDWQSPSDPDARITKMKDGTTGLAYKAENAVDLETEIVVAADVKPADAADGETVKDTVVDAQGNLNDASKQECRIAEVVADKGSGSGSQGSGRRCDPYSRPARLCGRRSWSCWSRPGVRSTNWRIASRIRCSGLANISARRRRRLLQRAVNAPVAPVAPVLAPRRWLPAAAGR